jgi:hypothetical protein
MERGHPALERATQIDPGFGRAYSAWAASLFYLGRTEESEALYKKAFGAMDRMTEREKYRVDARPLEAELAKRLDPLSRAYGKAPPPG